MAETVIPGSEIGFIGKSFVIAEDLSGSNVARVASEVAGSWARNQDIVPVLDPMVIAGLSDVTYAMRRVIDGHRIQEDVLREMPLLTESGPNGSVREAVLKGAGDDGDKALRLATQGLLLLDAVSAVSGFMQEGSSAGRSVTVGSEVYTTYTHNVPPYDNHGGDLWTETGRQLQIYEPVKALSVQVRRPRTSPDASFIGMSARIHSLDGLPRSLSTAVIFPYASDGEIKVRVDNFRTVGDFPQALKGGVRGIEPMSKTLKGATTRMRAARTV